MFKFFKEKIKSWVEKSKEKVEEEAEAAEEAVPEEEEREETEEEPTAKEKAKEEKRKVKEKKRKEKQAKKKEKEIKKKQEELEKLKKEAEEQESAIDEIEKEEEKLLQKIKGKPEEAEPSALEEKKEEKEEILERIEEEAEEEEQELEKLEKELEEAKEFEPVKRSAPTFQEIKKEKPTIFKKIKEKFSYKLSEEDFESIFDELEFMLLENNVALEATEAIKKQLKEELVNREIKKEKLEEEIKDALKKSIDNILIEPDDVISLIKEKKPFVIVFFGINGCGKSTTVAKVANLLRKNNISCVLAASDTFRAAAIEQLQQHADKLGLKVIKHDYGADPAAVGYDAIKHAKAHNIDAVLIDTAGRMHTAGNLLSEMEKICRVTAPDLKIFVAESIAGNDAIQQAKNFNQEVGIDGSILTKADVDEKGGTAISVSYVTKKPILFLGTGQEYDKIEVFNKEKFVEKLGL
jgi:fused signal recognition particle receptor